MSEADRLSIDSDGVVIACPECDVAGDIINRRKTNTYIGNPNDPFVCGKCSATFETAVVRKEKVRGNEAKYADLSIEDTDLSP